MRAQLLGVCCVVAISACGSTQQCGELRVNPLDEVNHCVGQATSFPDLKICWNPEDVQGKGLFPICFVDRAGTLFGASVSATTWIMAPGWTHSSTPTSSSTLSASDELRCSNAPVSDIPFFTCS